MAEPDLGFLGTQIVRVQDDLRTVKADVGQLRADVARIHAAQLRQDNEMHRGFAAIDARLETVIQQSTTNLEIMLNAFAGLSEKMAAMAAKIDALPGA